MTARVVFALIAVPSDQATYWAYVALIPIGGLLYLIYPGGRRE